MGRRNAYRPGDGLGFAMTLTAAILCFLSGIPQRLYALSDLPVRALLAWIPVILLSLPLIKFVSRPLYSKLLNRAGEEKAKKIDFIIWVISVVLLLALLIAASRKGYLFKTKFLF